MPPLLHRFDFHGAAAAFGGRLTCPPERVLDTVATCALTADGGRSSGSERRVSFGDILTIGAASASAEGLYDDREQQALLARGRAVRRPTTTTTVAADLRDLGIHCGPVFRGKRIRATLISRSPRGSGEPSIRLGEDTTFEGIAIGRSRLRIEINRTLFETYDTRARLVAACDDPRFLKQHGANLFLDADGTPMNGRGDLSSCAPIRGTIVREIAWEGRPHPGARIEGHTVVVDGLGRLAFGEIQITATLRRLTMLRVNLDCSGCGMIAFADVQDNGSWS